jgi:Tol biopolymer transport system component
VRFLSILTGACIAVLIPAATSAAIRGRDVLPASHIPSDAQLIFASDRAHEVDPWGLPADALYVATLDGRVTRITHSRFSDNHFEVSPNRRYIAVNRYSRGPARKGEAAGGLSGPNASAYFPLRDWKELWIVDTVTGRERRLVPQINAGDGGLAWSPDSQWVYFATHSVTGTMQIVRVNINTRKVVVVSRGLPRLLGKRAPIWVSDVGLSADGSRLVFVASSADVNQGKDKPRIATMAVDGSEAHFVSSGGPTPPELRGVWPVGDFDPDPSPDGRSVVFSRATDRGMVTPALSTFDILISDIDGKHEKDITPHGQIAAEFIPSWTWNDAGEIAFTRLGPGGMGPVVYNPRTGVRTSVNAHGSATHVQWIPSGRIQCKHMVCTAAERRAMEAVWRSAGRK